MAAEFRQDGYEYCLQAHGGSGRGTPCFFQVRERADDALIWTGDLRMLIEHLLLGIVAKQQLVEDMEAQRNSNPTVLLQALTKSSPGKAEEFMDLIGAAGQAEGGGLEQ